MCLVLFESKSKNYYGSWLDFNNRCLDLSFHRKQSETAEISTNRAVKLFCIFMIYKIPSFINKIWHVINELASRQNRHVAERSDFISQNS